MRKFAEFIIEKRGMVTTVIVIITVILAWFAKDTSLKVVFPDLLPQKHPYVELYNRVEKTFGGAHRMMVMVEVKEGNIFNPETLEKIKRITDELIYEFPGVDRYKVVSIAAAKVRDPMATSTGLEFPYLMFPEVPKNEAETLRLRNAVYSNDLIIGNLVSVDGKAALIYSDFLEWALDYRALFNKFKEVQKREEDKNHTISIAGEVLEKGYVWSYLRETLIITGFAILSMILLLYLVTREWRCTFIPVISGLVCAVWGLGFVRLLGYQIDPLFIMLPLLIAAREISHSVQYNVRFNEEFIRLKDPKAASIETLSKMFPPGFAGVVTDALGIVFIAVAPIPLLQKVGVYCFLWSFVPVLILVQILNPILFSWLPPQKQKKGKCRLYPTCEICPLASGGCESYSSERKLGLFDRIFFRLPNLCLHKLWIIGIFAVLAFVAIFYGDKVIIGDTHVGTPLLWPDSRYNQDVARINGKFPGVDQLYVVVEGKIRSQKREQEKEVISWKDFDKGMANLTASEELLPKPMQQEAVLMMIEAFQKYMLKNSDSVSGVTSYYDLVKNVNRLLYEDYPKWELIPNQALLGNLFTILRSKSQPGDWDQYATVEFDDANTVIYLKDHKGETVREGIKTARDFIDHYPVLPEAKLSLAAGPIGAIAAINETIEKYNFLMNFLAVASTFLMVWLIYRSFVAGVIMIISLFIANMMTFAYMYFQGIGLNINCLPVTCIAVGIGVDYAIYLVSRMKDEYAMTKEEDYFVLVKKALYTSGKAVTFTVLCITFSVVLWVFSSVRFQAEVGLLMTIVTFLHWFGTFLFIPAMILLIKPKFIKR